MRTDCPINSGGNGCGIRVAIPLAPLMMIVNQRNSVEVHLGYNVDGNYDAGLLPLSLLLFSVSDFKARCGPPVLHRRSGSSCAQHGRLSLLKANYGRECVVTLNDVRNVLYAYYTAFREDSLPHNISPLICAHLLLIDIELHA